MAGKITSYSPFTTVNPADLLVGVDISDTSMALSGTDKKLTLSQLAAGLFGWYPVVPSGDLSGVTDTAAIQAAVNSGIAWLAPGTFYTSSPVTIGTAGCGLVGGHGRWYHGAAGGPVIQAVASFTGSAIVNITASEVEVGGLTIDGTAVSSAAAVDGLDMTGPISNGYVHDLLIRNAPQYGFQAVYSSGNPFTSNFRKVIVDGTGNAAGWNIANMTDCMFDNCYSIGSHGQGWYLYGNGNTVLQGCRAEWSSTGVGYQIDGNVGPGVRMIGCSTDRNATHGVQFTCTGTDPVVISGMICHRDGASSTSSGYAGVMFASGVTNRVVIDGLAVYTGKNDDGSGNASPQYGVNMTGTHPTFVAISNAYLNGVTAGQNSVISAANGFHWRLVYTEPANPPSGTVTNLADDA